MSDVGRIHSNGVKGLVSDTKQRLNAFNTVNLKPLSDPSNVNAPQELKSLAQDIKNFSSIAKEVRHVGENFSELCKHEKAIDNVMALLEGHETGSVAHESTPSDDIINATAHLVHPQTPQQDIFSAPKSGEEITYKIVPFDLMAGA